MTLYERLEEKAKEMGFSSITKFFDTAGVNNNARASLKKTGHLSDTYKMRIARVLKCSVGDINRMMSEAQADALKKDWPEKAKCSPSKPAAEPEPAPAGKAKEDVKSAPAPEPAPEPEPVPVPEPEPVAEVEPEPEQATEQPTEDQILEEKIEEIKGKADVLLTYHDRIKNAAEATLAAEYAAMLRSRMLDVAMADLYDLCREFMDGPNPNKAAAIGEVAGEILKLKEGE